MVNMELYDEIVKSMNDEIVKCGQKYYHTQIINAIREYYSYLDEYRKNEDKNKGWLRESLGQYDNVIDIDWSSDETEILDVNIPSSFEEAHPRGSDRDSVYDKVDYIHSRDIFDDDLEYKKDLMSDLEIDIENILDLPNASIEDINALESSIYGIMDSIDKPLFYETMDKLIDLRPKAFSHISMDKDNEEYIRSIKNTKKPFKKLMGNLKKVINENDLMSGYKTDFNSLDVDGSRKRKQ